MALQTYVIDLQKFVLHNRCPRVPVNVTLTSPNISEEDKENIPDSQPSSTLVTSKDTQHILRLAAVLSVLQDGVNAVLKNNEATEETNEVSDIRLQQASALYFTLQQHKDIFVQVNKVLFMLISRYIPTEMKQPFYTAFILIKRSVGAITFCIQNQNVLRKNRSM